jgi:hypothetical protein
MSAVDTFHCRDLHLRHTDTSGCSAVREHRVWDADRFVDAQQRAASKLNAEAVAEGKPARAKVEVITPELYRAERNAR